MPKTNYYWKETEVSREITTSFLKEVFDSLPDGKKKSLRRAYNMIPETRGFGFVSFLEFVFKATLAEELTTLEERVYV